MLLISVGLLLLLLNRVLYTAAVTQDFYWREYTQGDIPCDAYEVAPGKYIGQVNFEGHTNVATIYSYDGVAAIEWWKRIDVSKNIQILCAPDPTRLYWELVDFTKENDSQMKDVVKGGYNLTLKIPLFIGKSFQDGEWKIGKVGSITHPHKGLYIWNKENKSLRLDQFHILKYNFTMGGSDAAHICRTIPVKNDNF